MARVEIAKGLFEEIERRFKRGATKVYDLLESLEENPWKGKLLTNVAGILVKEVKYRGYRFYFLVEGHKLKFFSEKELVDLLIRFVRMSDKRHQQKVIDEIRDVLRKIGPSGLE